MADWVTLFALAGAIYLVECVAWIEGPATACFRPVLRGAWTGARGEDLPGNDRGGLAFVDPLTTSGGLVAGRGWSFAMSPDGISNLASDPWTLGRAEPRFIAWSEIQTVQANFGTLDINGAAFARVGSTMLAVDLAEDVRVLGRLAATDRAAAVESAVRGALDENRVQDAWTGFRRQTRGLAILATCLLGYVFVVSPAVLLGIAPHPYWMYIVGGLLALALSAATLFVRLHSQFYPGFTFERWMHAISMVAIPIAAIRSVDKLSRERLRAFSPTVIVPSLCGAAVATPLLRRVWFDLPVPAGAPDRCTAWFLELLRQETKAALDRQKVPVLSPPEKDPGMSNYCPRCHTQFTAGRRGDCPECPDMRLASFG
jgi:hypothetical protein